MASSSQTPAPKVSGKTLDKDVKPSESNLKKTMAEAEKGAAKKTTATKTPQKIQDGDTKKKKSEY
ncbi:hypothetical protein R1T16_06210 [Flavobacterium sp. DG1-102-2]|uniref:hypothetical protein n=1 Tax=Flavobacterium sp. DG1-102-2 TaxID=3081663 RepID=UPI0029495E08|nr:hypothetical protein [Flavobacterium sp. DG1-102-2]MDV6168010.1 hypothetical protein [Flavobacterium sp. DG1-102-2]